MARANLFIIGAMKSGTTSLHNYLNEHPQIFMCEPKEPGYFVEELKWDSGPEWYESLFSNASGVDVIGESSTHYTKRPTYQGVAEKIFEYNPDARFIYQMRDPVERAISQYWHNVRDLEYVGERRAMYDAILHDPEYVFFSDYAYQLEPYFKLFGHDRVYIQTFEAMRDNPQQCLSSIFGWLGVDDLFLPEHLNKKWNVMSDELQQARGRGLLNSFRYSGLWSRVSPLFPSFIKDLGIRMSLKHVERSENGKEQSIQYLRGELCSKIENLEQILGREFPEWRTLHAGGD